MRKLRLENHKREPETTLWIIEAVLKMPSPVQPCGVM
jgi:hypothetical protein